ncbi:hypothetical protein K438DRAFT_1905213 [Mycena galopus ATCC 62051]|nr:hypothetical protein K438DRAFT_1905213 [Mycena galopus ATCC 62051]
MECHWHKGDALRWDPSAGLPRWLSLSSSLRSTANSCHLRVLDHMTADLGGKLKSWAKREDCNSALQCSFGDNKARKPDTSLLRPLRNLATPWFQSAPFRATTRAAKVANIQLSRLMGAEPQLEPATFSINPTAAALTAEVFASGGKPYYMMYIPTGAIDHPLGGIGFARRALRSRAKRCSSTLRVGMIAGFKLLEKTSRRARKIIDIDASAKQDETPAQVFRVARFTAPRIGLSEHDITEADVILQYHVGCCDIPDKQTIEAIKYGASMDAFVMDPVYERKSLTGMIDTIKKRERQLALNAYSDVNAVGGV